jgi:hypothetical protein
MGKTSAWGALAFGGLWAGYAILNLTWGMYWIAPAAVSLPLLLGGYRTLRKLSGGLRLLAGAWGLAAGVMIGSLLSAPRADADNPNLYSVDEATAAFVLALPFVALAGLALAVLHKER